MKLNNVGTYFPLQYSIQKNGKIKFPSKTKTTYFAEPMRLTYIITEGAYQPITLQKFNPGSRQQIQTRLKLAYDWEPEIFTKAGTPKVDADTLASLPYAETDPLKEYLKLSKDLSALKGYMDAYNPTTFSIHGRCDALGTNTRRAAHSSPNLGQVNKGEDFRSLFSVPDGWTFVGADASALELKILAHYLYPYDGGAYDRAITSGDKSNGTDVHSMAQKAMGLPDRDSAKQATYSILYGSSATRVGWSLLKSADPVDYTPEEYSAMEERMRKRVVLLDGRQLFPIAKDMLIPFTHRLVEQGIYGDRVVTGFKNNLLGYKDFIADIESQVVDDRIQCIDGGYLHVRSKHSLANLLFQSAGSIAVKYWMVETHRRLAELPQDCYKQMAYIHDELDFMVKDEYAHKVGQILSDSMKAVRSQLNLNVDLEAEYQTGSSWYTVH